MISFTIIGSFCHLFMVYFIYHMVFVPPKNCLEWKLDKRYNVIAIGFMTFFMLCFILSWVCVIGVIYE